ncbi:MAG: GNAT family protein [Dehalococcoidia bacterium]|nr:GNAT family protein [Dehalococcoidia bacterium]
MGALLSLPTPRLVLRDFEESDFAAVHRYGSDPEVARLVPWGPNHRRDTRRFLRQAIAARGREPRKRYDLAIVLKPDGVLIGGCGIQVLPDSQGEIGYAVARDFWGRGYATEAAYRLLAFGFRGLDLHRIFATCDVENVASWQVLEKLGMRREGHLREDRLQKGRWRDSYLYAILEQEWKVLAALAT